MKNHRSFHILTSKYIELFFWDYDYGICKKEISKLEELFNDKQFDFEFFVINVNADLKVWKQSLMEYDFSWINVNGTRSVTEEFSSLSANNPTLKIKYCFPGPFVFAIYILNSKEIISLRNSITCFVKKNSTRSAEVITPGFSE